MGLDLSFVDRNGNEPADLPEHFSNRYVFRHALLSALWEVKTEMIKTCGCPEKHYYGCSEPDPTRPADFEEFRQKLKEFEILQIDECAEMVDYLETHPEIYLTFSN